MKSFLMLKWGSLSSSSHGLDLLYLLCCGAASLQLSWSSPSTHPFQDDCGLLVDIGGCKGNIWCPILLAVNQCTWGRVPAKPRGVTAFFLFFSLSLKEPTANASSYSTQCSQQESLLWEILRNGHILLGAILWLASQLSSRVYCLHPPTPCSPVDILLLNDSRLEIGLTVAEDHWICLGSQLAKK